MRYFLLATVLALAIAIAPDAQACQQCKIDVFGCPVCRETDYDGYQNCVILAGDYCYPYNGYCTGPLGQEQCGGNPEPCPHEKWVLSLPEKREIRLTKVSVIRPGGVAGT